MRIKQGFSLPKPSCLYLKDFWQQDRTFVKTGLRKLSKAPKNGRKLARITKQRNNFLVKYENLENITKNYRYGLARL